MPGGRDQLQVGGDDFRLRTLRARRLKLVGGLERGMSKKPLMSRQPRQSLPPPRAVYTFFVTAQVALIVMCNHYVDASIGG